MDIPKPPAIAGNLFQAAGILYNIYSSYKTTEFRDNVEQGLKLIEGELDEISKMIKQFDRKATYWQQWNELDNPLNVIDNAYGYFPNSPTVSADTIATAMMNVHMAICGNAMPVQTKNLQLFVDQLVGSKLMTSKVETAYNYFTRYLVGRMVRGFVMLSVNDEKLFKEWYGFLKTGNTESDQEYLKHPFLEYEGQMCQQVIDGLKDKDDWAGQANPAKKNIETNHVNIGGAPDIPDDNAVVGYDFYKAGNDALDVVFWYGKIDKYGYVASVEKAVPGKSAKKVYAGTKSARDDADEPYITNYGFIDTNPVSVPEGHAIVNVKWRQSTGKFHIDTGDPKKAQPVWSMVYLSVEHAEIQPDGIIDMSTAIWTKSNRGGEISLEVSLGKTTVKKPDGVEWYTREAKTDQPEENASGITGVQVRHRRSGIPRLPQSIWITARARSAQTFTGNCLEVLLPHECGALRSIQISGVIYKSCCGPGHTVSQRTFLNNRRH